MEADEQKALIEWAAWASGKHPELELLYHIPNGGSRHPAEAVRLKEQGVKAGVPDLCLPVPKNCFHGLFIEMKYGNGRLSDKQKQWIHDLLKNQYAVYVCYTMEEAKTAICNYLGIGE